MTTAEQTYEAQAAQRDQVIFEAESKALWDLDVKSKQSGGWHPPSFHVNSREVAPPKNADGKTYCHACSLDLVDWKDASEDQKAFIRHKVSVVRKAQNEAAATVGPLLEEPKAAKDKLAFYKQLAESRGKQLMATSDGMDALGKFLHSEGIKPTGPDENAAQAALRVLKTNMEAVKDFAILQEKICQIQEIVDAKE